MFECCGLILLTQRWIQLVCCRRLVDVGLLVQGTLLLVYTFAAAKSSPRGRERHVLLDLRNRLKFAVFAAGLIFDD